jgi:hypothetical protein
MPCDQAAEAAPRSKVGTQSIQTFETTAGAIAAHPQFFYGSVVSVSAEVEDKLSAQAFTLDEDAIGAGPDVVVIAPRAVRGLEEDQNLRVVGYLQPLVVTEFERDYGWFDSNWFNGTMGVEVDVHQRPVLIASSITTENGEELLGMDQGSGRERGQEPNGDAARP